MTEPIDPPSERHGARRTTLGAGVLVAVAGVELRRWWRQPLAVATALAMPVVVASLISVALGSEGSFSPTFAVADLDRGPAARSFVENALGNRQVAEVVETRLIGTQSEARHLAGAGDVAAAIILPAGLSEWLGERPPGASMPRIEVIQGAESTLGADLAETLVEVFEVRARATSAALSVSGRPLPDTDELSVDLVAPGGRSMDAATYYGPAVGLFFVLLALGFVVDRQVADRERGLIDRLAATPAPGWATMAGRSFAALSVGLASLAITATTMQLVFGRSWGPATSVAALGVAVAVAYAGLATVIASVVRTPGQAQGLTAGLAFAMALGSGTFSVPGSASSRPPFAELIPTTLALDGFALTTTEGVGVSALGTELAGLVAIGAVGLLVAGLWLRRGIG